MSIEITEAEKSGDIEKLGVFSNQKLSVAIMPIADADPQGRVTPVGIEQLLSAVTKLQRSPQWRNKHVYFQIRYAPLIDNKGENPAKDSGANLRVLLTSDGKFHFFDEMRELRKLRDLREESPELPQITLAQQSADETDSLIISTLMKERTHPNLFKHLDFFSRHFVILIAPAERMSFWLKGYGNDLGSPDPKEFCEPAFCILYQGVTFIDYRGGQYRGPIKL